MREGIQNQLAPLAVPLPFGDDLHVHAALNGAGDEHAPEGSVAVRW